MRIINHVSGAAFLCGVPVNNASDLCVHFMFDFVHAPPSVSSQNLMFVHFAVLL